MALRDDLRVCSAQYKEQVSAALALCYVKKLATSTKHTVVTCSRMLSPLRGCESQCRWKVSSEAARCNRRCSKVSLEAARCNRRCWKIKASAGSESVSAACQCHPRAVLAAAAAVFVLLIFFRNNFSKFSASIFGGPPSIILRILGVRPWLRRRDRLRTRERST